MKTNRIILILLFLIGTLTLLNATSYDVNFDTDGYWAGGSMGSYNAKTYINPAVPAVFSTNNAFRETAGTQDGFPKTFGTYSWRLNQTAGAKFEAAITSGGVSTFSVKVRRWDGSPEAVYDVSYSTNGGTSWTNITTINAAFLNSSSNWKTIDGNINASNAAGDIIVKIQNTSGERLMVDDFSFTSYSAPQVPTADFTADKADAGIGEAVTFTNASLNFSGTILYSWDFDGDSIEDSDLENPVYQYDTAGTYNVTLMVLADNGSDSETKTAFVTVHAATADFSAPATSLTMGDTVTFNPTTQYLEGSLTYSWDLDGDNIEDATTQNPNFTYNTVGTYTVTLTVTGDYTFATETKTNYITVAAPRELPYLDNFETGAVGWTIYSAASNKDWALTTSSPYQGANAMSINNYGGNVAAEDYLITPAINLNASAPVLTFWAYTQYTDSAVSGLKILLSTDYALNNPTAGWTDITSLATGMPAANSQVWSEVTLDLSAYNHQTVRIAFLHESSGTSSNSSTFWKIDRVNIRHTPTNTNQTTVTAGTTPLWDNPTQDCQIQFTAANSGEVNLSVSFFDHTVPSGNAPVDNLATRYWEVIATGAVDGAYTIRLDLTGILGISDFSSLVMLKREDASQAWAIVPGAFYDAPYIVAQGLTSFSEFTVGGNDSDGNTLPVELSSFSALITTANYVSVNWTVQSENALLGYNVYRNGQADFANSIKINNSVIHAENNSSAKSYSFLDNSVESNNVYYYWLESVDLDGTATTYGPVNVTLGTPGQGDTPEPTNYITALKGNSPNPFNPVTDIRFELKEAGNVKIEIFNVRGALIKTFNEDRQAGSGTFTWNGRNDRGKQVGSGVYYYRMQTAGYTNIKKMLLLK